MESKTQSFSRKKINITIGIITIQNIKNYGACLQSFALWHAIQSLGYKCEIINLLTPAHKGFQKSKNFNTYEKRISLPKRCYRLCKEKINHIHQKILLINQMQQIKRKEYNFERFNSQISFSRIYKNADELYNNPPIYDIYVTGSDQVWNPTLGFELEAYFLTFTPQNTKKIAYAPSIARNDLPSQFIDKYRKWLKNYNHLSIREKSGQTILETILKKQVPLVLDPTFLLSKEEWISQMPKGITFPPKYILCFTLSDKKLVEYAVLISKEAQLPLLVISTYVNYKIKNAKMILDAGPSELISYIYNAEMVITDSFHGVAISIQLARNFFAYIKQQKKYVPDISDRIRTIINQFDLNEHIITDYRKRYKTLSQTQYDRHKLDKQINAERDKSLSYLKQSLTS